MPARAVPYRKGLTALLALIPVLSLGLLGMVPSMVLAVDRRRRADIVGAAVIGLMEVGLFVAAALTPEGEPIDNLTTGLLLFPLFLGTPVHFLLMNRRDRWPAGAAPVPAPYGYAYPPVGYLPQPGPTVPPGPMVKSGPTMRPAPPYAVTEPHPANPYATPYPPAAPAVPPAPAVPAPAAPTGAAELRELGELLRRQAGNGQP
ncbi:hypothetical protein OU787_19745 [Kitasatospora sp. YST-16]|uniref:hypothetical protein n=1 Tax=Kitasatospora sp. YST-16 TaxID=2998080 RepID=UPI0022838681|nr:hypothetical protein [Kitasatospora sp. YST-16]WAL73546.1 hypothetical protein OU787_19745 [Kitasatospora sp. YST-16]WNW39602.1 hypothetical protein RKE32_19690 [Streptomyces sp. Li-HN-5-13]